MTSRPPVARAMPAPSHRRRSSPPERYYVGRRPDRSAVFIVSRTELEPLAHLSYQSDAAFDWGRLTEGALELAFAILVHTTQSRPTDLVSQTFCGEVVACLERAGFVLSQGDVALWLLTAFREDASRHEREVDRPVGLRRRAVRRIRSWRRRT